MSKVIVDEIQTDTTNGNVRVIPNGTGALEVKGAGGDDAILQLNCSAQSHGVKLKSPAHSAGQSYTMILPDNQIAADKFLKVKSITGSGATAVGQLEYADAGGGAYEFVKKIQPSVATTTITEHGLDYDSVYKLVLKYVVGSFYNYLKFYPHLDNSTTSFTPDGSGFDTCKQRQIDINGVSSEIESTDHWSFGTTQVGYEFGGSIDFWTGYRPWIIGNVRYLYNDGFVQLYGRKGRTNNTNNDTNQTGTYAKMNGFTLNLNGWDFNTSTELLLYKHKES